MNGETLQRIRQASPVIRDRWEALLRSAPPTTPVSNLDAMTNRIPESLAQIIRALSWGSVRRMPRRSRPPARRCAHNPFRTYFRAGEQAILEAMALPDALREPSPSTSAATPAPAPSASTGLFASSAPSDLSNRAAPSNSATASVAAVSSAALASLGAADPADAAALTRAVDRLASADLDAFCCVCRKYRLVSVCRCQPAEAER